MGWKKLSPVARATDFYLESNRFLYTAAKVDWEHLVTLDFETYWADDYTLSKSSTSEYVRDKRFEAQMVGVKIGLGPVEVIPYNRIRSFLRRINWATHDLLCHHTQFDGFILSHHFGVVPRKYYCTLSMARAWLSNDIGAGLDDVSKFLGREGKLDGGKASHDMKGYRAKNMHPQVFAKGMEYCAQDTLECHEIFRILLPNFSQEEIDLIDLTCQMFCCPVLKLDEKLCRVAMEQEIKERDDLLLSIAGEVDVGDLSNEALREITGEQARGKAEHDILRALVSQRDARLYVARKTLGSNEKFADLLRSEGADPPYKISPTWMKLDREEQEAQIDKKYTYAFAKDDIGFIALMEEADTDRIRELCEARIAVKSNSNITRSERLLRSGANGRAIPVYYKFAAAHTWRFGGGDKMNFQNFKRGGILRRCIYAPRGYVIIWADSSQIEVRVNAWLWGQEDLLDDFRDGIDIYSKFGTETVYGYPVSKATPLERHVCKTAVLGLGYGMGAEKFKTGLAQGKGGPRVVISDDFAAEVVRAYRKRFNKIAAGWQVCNRIIEDMASGRQGEYKCLRWEKETLWLPNGMRMKYPNLSYDEEEGQWTYTRKGAKIKIYGAKLNENIVQALARIIVAAEQMLAIGQKLPVVMTTHDEVCAIAPKEEAERWQGFMAKIMRIAPKWCPDIPLDCEYGYSAQYS